VRGAEKEGVLARGAGAERALVRGAEKEGLLARGAGAEGALMRGAEKDGPELARGAENDEPEDPPKDRPPPPKLPPPGPPASATDRKPAESTRTEILRNVMGHRMVVRSFLPTRPYGRSPQPLARRHGVRPRR